VIRAALAAALLAMAVVLSGRGRPAISLQGLSRTADHRGSGAEPHRATPEPVPWALVLDLLAAVLGAGASVTGAVRALGEALHEVADPSAGPLLELAAVLELGAASSSAGSAARAPAHVQHLLDLLALSLRTGMAPVPLVTAAADSRRRSRAQAQALAAQRLGVLVVLPTGLCLLPAFVLLTVAPLVLDLLT
jgi:hypothetical protein